ncbi:MAG: hypothetical protein ACP5Q3_16340 [bacterium]
MGLKNLPNRRVETVGQGFIPGSSLIHPWPHFRQTQKACPTFYP